MSNSLFEIALKNKNLLYIDTDNSVEYKLSDFKFNDWNFINKSLVFLYIDNSISSIKQFWSFFKSNHCISLLSPMLADNLKQELESSYQPYFIYDPTRIAIDLYSVKRIDNLNIFEFKGDHINYTIDSRIKLLLSTSGTTGSPKFVKLSEENIILNAYSILDYLPVNENDVSPLNLPLYYSYGLSIFTTNSIRGGKIACSNENLLSKTFWENLNRFGYTSIAGVPFVYEMLDRMGFMKKSYPSLKYLTQAGGKLNDNLLRKFHEYSLINKIQFFVMYGQTEATARMSVLLPKYTEHKIGSIGKAIKNGTFTIDSETNELVYTGPNVFGGYAQSYLDLAIYEDKGALHTGDIARVDEDGFYYITGRLKRFVKLFGNRINLDEIETSLSSKFLINAKCAGFNDKILFLFIIENTVSDKEIIQYLNKQYKLHPSVIKIKIVDCYPLTVNGKVNYAQLLSEHGNS
jgi:long-chain acyl-CoA synthetase